ncbi:uncharacterized protein SPSK_07806 [Sporothrix schenckii 1099-18]|uniref:Rhodopsin domain-containing protein n=1 Tax=Sporothrix schenckii 1099-18 TaxID=1397361 RepID=A0A0F2MEW9_SPOSC|nr:uncharacterized protein SPSK_07806 [Sporothrix schenckii 1099-18]KJR88177.1 hypothetical protein SPSK_07806 [Sporothrix schenckii 1099-18]
MFYIANASYVSSTAFMKLALLFQFLRVFKNDSIDSKTSDTAGRTFLRRTCQVLIVIVAAWGATFSFLAWVPCLPVSTYWDGVTNQDPNHRGTCYGFGISTDRTAFIAHTAINMGLDICVLAIPVPLYLGNTVSSSARTSAPGTLVIRSSLRTRAGVIVLLLLGALVNVFAAWRLALLIGSGGSVLETYVDSTFYAPDTVLLSSLEVNLASICASVPIFWPVLRQQVFRILVTREVEIVRDERPGDDASDDEDDVAKLKQRQADNDGHDHYDDAFIRDQVDPLRPGTSAGVETRVRSERGVQKTRRWRLRMW